jgi:hypothetical protein
MTRQALGLLTLTVVLSAGTINAQKVTVEPDQKYLVLEVQKLATFETELNSAADLGFRLAMSTTSDDNQRVQALLERTATPPEVYNYRLVATFSTKTGDKEMNAAADQGYRAVSHTSMVKKGLTIFNSNQVVVMEKAPSSAARYEYRTLTAIRTPTMHRELKAAVDEGWKVIDMTYGQILMERERK